jgi:Tol biopolymer transport system component
MMFLPYAIVSVLIAVGPAAGRGSRLVFEQESVAGDHTQTDLFTIAPGGSGLRRLTDTPGLNELAPSWNGAGTRITFWRTPAPYGAGAVWTMDAAGRHQRRLTTKSTDARDPVFDHAGTRIVYTDVTDHWNLWMMRSDGSGQHRVTAGAAFDFEAAWSPDGRSLAFTRGTEQGDPGDIYVLRLATGRLTRVTSSPDYDHQVDWSPDGRHLVFERDTPTNSSIFSVRPDGHALTRLTTGRYFDVGPTYSPDGRQIAFGSNRAGVLDDLWIMSATGRNQHLVRPLPGSDSFPDWRR